MTKFEIVELSTGNKTALNLERKRVYVPQGFRENIKVGNWSLITTEHFDKQRQLNAETNELELIDEPMDREGICFVGSYQQVVEKLHQDKILAKVDEAIINNAIVKAAKDYGVVEVDAKALIG